MDESGFAIGSSQSSRALVTSRNRRNWKVVHGRQEWITAIECISAAGVAVPPLIIFKAKHTSSSWIPEHTLLDWRFSTSNSGWTSDSHGYEWLSTVFEPCTRPEDLACRRLLIADGHSSHITAKAIAFRMAHAIDLLILPPHCLHILQPLDVGVFAPLKRALASETDEVSRIYAGLISRAECTEMYIRARETASSVGNFRRGWRATGLEPPSPITLLEKLNQMSKPPWSNPRTPGHSPSLDTSLLFSSPPEGTELREANSGLNHEIRNAGNAASLIERYMKPLTRNSKATQSENVTLSDGKSWQNHRRCCSLEGLGKEVNESH